MSNICIQDVECKHQVKCSGLLMQGTIEQMVIVIFPATHMHFSNWWQKFSEDVMFPATGSFIEKRWSLRIFTSSFLVSCALWTNQITFACKVRGVHSRRVLLYSIP